MNSLIQPDPGCAASSPGIVMSAFIEVAANKRSIAQRKSIFGRGINDAPYMTQPRIDGKQVVCHFYSVWTSVLERCYSEKFQKKCPTYIGCSVCDSWLSFMAFKSWMVKQNWQDMALDKDLFVPGNKLYSPATCLFISQELNKLLCDRAADRGDLPIGVCKNGKGFAAFISINGKRKHLGTYTTIEEAAAVYRTAKSNHIISLAKQQTDDRIMLGLYRNAQAIFRRAAA